jgi:hypothetical protein
MGYLRAVILRPYRHLFISIARMYDSVANAFESDGTHCRKYFSTRTCGMWRRRRWRQLCTSASAFTGRHGFFLGTVLRNSAKHGVDDGNGRTRSRHSRWFRIVCNNRSNGCRRHGLHAANRHSHLGERRRLGKNDLVADQHDDHHD